MRAQLFLAIALVAAGSLAGCIGGEKEGGVTETPPGTEIGAHGTPGTTGVPQLTVLSALNAAITTDAPEWVASGTEVPVAISAPANAKGAISYTWAIGPLPGTVEVVAAKADTGSKGSDYIQPGTSKSITFSTAGIYRLHCHPHPEMRHNVTVIEGYAGPKSVEVAIVDGEARSSYRYVPENIVVGVGTVVTYKNLGEQPHTATALGAQEPALKKLPLTAASGSVVVEGEGWMRLVAVFQDSEGRIGIAEKPIYTTATLPAYEPSTHSFSFEYGLAPLAGTPAAAQPKSEPVSLEQGGLVFINYTFADAAAGAGAPENLAEVEVHFTKDGETQDTLTGGGNTDALSGKALAGAYTLKVVPVQGAQISGTVTIEVIYDLVPPAPTAPSAAPADDGHGGHAH